MNVRVCRTGRTAKVLTLLALVCATFLAGCGIHSGEPTQTGAASESAPVVDPTDPSLSLDQDPERKHRAAQITSTFENATLELQYGYVENIGDGRGITAGRPGFTSGTGDLLLFVQRYTEVKPGNALAHYLPALEAVNGSDSETGLEGFAEAWAEEATDPAQQRLQDALVDELYFSPAMDLAEEAGLRTPLGQAIVWDTMIQHGLGGDNGTEAIIRNTTDAVGAVGDDEAAWLHVFLDARLHHLGHVYEGTTDDADASSRSRVDALRSLLQEGEMALEPPLRWEVYGNSFVLEE